ncbi:hypothetical protein [Neobacillus endophyticus]|nr:hypothetical protein [Neobacillus endophyticus]
MKEDQQPFTFCLLKFGFKTSDFDVLLWKIFDGPNSIPSTTSFA